LRFILHVIVGGVIILRPVKNGYMPKSSFT
jgi:hypothetical protein